MTLEAIIHAIETRYPDLTRQESRAVATDIMYSGEPTKEVLADEGIVDKLVSGFRSRLSAANQSVAANDPTICPVCKLPLKPVSLANDRKAVFCQKHFVVFPLRVEGKNDSK